jgi:hypothetical protein
MVGVDSVQESAQIIQIRMVHVPKAVYDACTSFERVWKASDKPSDNGLGLRQAERDVPRHRSPNRSATGHRP